MVWDNTNKLVDSVLDVVIAKGLCGSEDWSDSNGWIMFSSKLPCRNLVAHNRFTPSLRGGGEVH